MSLTGGQPLASREFLAFLFEVGWLFRRDCERSAQNEKRGSCNEASICSISARNEGSSLIARATERRNSRVLDEACEFNRYTRH
jgi:hypothetical protein